MIANILGLIGGLAANLRRMSWWQLFCPEHYHFYLSATTGQVDCRNVAFIGSNRDSGQADLSSSGVTRPEHGCSTFR